MVLAVFAIVFFGVFLVFLVCGGWWFLECPVDMVCLLRRDVFTDELEYDSVITFLFLVRLASDFDQ